MRSFAQVVHTPFPSTPSKKSSQIQQKVSHPRNLFSSNYNQNSRADCPSFHDRSKELTPMRISTKLFFVQRICKIHQNLPALPNNLSIQHKNTHFLNREPYKQSKRGEMQPSCYFRAPLTKKKKAGASFTHTPIGRVNEKLASVEANAAFHLQIFKEIEKRESAERQLR